MFNRDDRLPLRLHEIAIAEISNTIREKGDWKSQYNTPEIVTKWSNEPTTQDENAATKLIDKFREYWNYVVEELKWIESLEKEYLEDASFKIAFHDGVVCGNGVVSEETRSRLARQTCQLYNLVKEEDVVYHPKYNKQVVELVHPSLFPLQYQVTISKELLKPIDYPPELLAENNYKETAFQWLPSLWEYNGSSNRYEIVSYINNLHPVKFKLLYKIIEEVFNDCVPGLNYVLSRLRSEHYQRGEEPDPYDPYNEDPKEEEIEAQCNDLLKQDKSDEAEELWKQHKIKLIKNDIPKWKETPETRRLNVVKDFPQLKVITKLTNIELTPDDPTYKEGIWHFEGTRTENIVASILFYYKTDNINNSRLSLAELYDNSINYELQNDIFVREVYGLEEGDPLARVLGTFKAEQGKIAIFPNCFPHRVESFELTDKTKKGRMKILSFFVVNPTNEVVKSTADVVPEQMEWKNDPSLSCLFPPDLDDTFAPQTLEDARNVRKKIMEERSNRSSGVEDFDGLPDYFSLGSE